jgi:hypothetical protein
MADIALVRPLASRRSVHCLYTLDVFFISYTDCRFFSEAVEGAGLDPVCLTRAAVLFHFSLRSPLIAPLPFHSVPALVRPVAEKSVAASAARLRHRVTRVLARASARAAAVAAAAAVGASRSSGACQSFNKPLAMFSHLIRTHLLLASRSLVRSSKSPPRQRRSSRPTGWDVPPSAETIAHAALIAQAYSQHVRPARFEFSVSLYFVGV